MLNRSAIVFARMQLMCSENNKNQSFVLCKAKVFLKSHAVMAVNIQSLEQCILFVVVFFEIFTCCNLFEK